ncbi:MAG: hypothetical protein K1X42_00585 [Opitutaceae bacterium]|nr:hypothetical protein [Opitutaceae bacterium]
MNIKNLIYALTALSFTVVIGGAIYEHLAVVPIWTAAPPRSLAMFQGEYGLHPEMFWMPIHPVTLVLFVVTLILSWKSARRRNVLISFIGYVVLLAITAIYFVPELMAITRTAYANTIDASLTERAATWEMLSLVRLAILIGLSLTLFLGLTKTSDPKNQPKTSDIVS